MTLIFLLGKSYQGKFTGETTTFWLVVTCCVSYPIRYRGFFDQQKNLKELIDNHQKKVVLKDATLVPV